MSRMFVGAVCGVWAVASAACTVQVDDDFANEGAPSAIINGAEDEADLAVVRLFGESEDDPKKQVFCTGTLIHPQLVLTAAHCLFDFTSVDENGGRPQKRIARVGFGLHGTERTVEVSDQLANPDFDPNRFGPVFDVAIVALAEPVNDVPAIPVSDNALVGQPKPADVAQDSIRLVGFGHNVPSDNFGTGFGTKRTATLAAAPFGSLEAPDNRDQFVIRASDATGTQACFGDSGAPVLFRENGEEKLVAVTSSASRNCQGGSNHTRTASFNFEFIQAVLSQFAAEP